MPETYEQKKLLEYLIKYLKRHKRYILDCDIKLCKELICSAKFPKVSITSNTPKTKILKYLNDLYKSFPKDCPKSEMQDFIDSVCSIYNCNKGQAEILNVFYRYNILDMYLPFRIKDKDFYELCRAVINDGEKLLYERIDELEENGLKLYFLDAKQLKELYNKVKNKKSISEITDELMGGAIATAFSKSDFAHMSKELNLCKDIINKAIEGKKVGINILLYGNSGTGKTEFAKLLGKVCNKKVYMARFTTNSNKKTSTEYLLQDLQNKIKTIKHLKTPAIIVLDSINELPSDKLYIENLLENTPYPVIWVINDENLLQKNIIYRMAYSVKFSNLADKAQFEIWQRLLEKHNLNISPQDIQTICNKYVLPIVVINKVIETTRLVNGDFKSLRKFIQGITAISNLDKTKDKD